jgi:hypothetical protein
VGCVFCFFFVFVFWRKRRISIKTKVYLANQRRDPLLPGPRSNATSPGHPPAPPGLHKPRPSSPPPSPPSLRPSSTAPEVQHQIAAAVQDSPTGGDVASQTMATRPAGSPVPACIHACGAVELAGPGRAVMHSGEVAPATRTRRRRRCEPRRSVVLDALREATG